MLASGFWLMHSVWLGIALFLLFIPIMVYSYTLMALAVHSFGLSRIRLGYAGEFLYIHIDEGVGVMSW